MKRSSRGFLLLLACLLAALIALEACGPRSAVQNAPPRTQSELQGTIRVSGAWALYPMMVKWSEEFTLLHPKVRIDVSAGGAGKGVADALAGLVDIGMVSRDIKVEEVNQGAFFVEVVKDAVFPTINASNPWLAAGVSRRGFQKQAFVDLWITRKPLTWGELSGGQAGDLVQVYTRSDSCGAAETWANYLGGAQEDLLGTAVYGDPGLAEAVRTDTFGIGYNNLNYAYDATTGLPVAGLAVIAIDVNGNGTVDPEEDLSTKDKAIRAIATGAYPSPPARGLYLLGKGRFGGVTSAFVRWILTNGQSFVGEVGYIPLTSTQVMANLQKLGD